MGSRFIDDLLIFIDKYAQKYCKRKNNTFIDKVNFIFQHVYNSTCFFLLYLVWVLLRIQYKLE